MKKTILIQFLTVVISICSLISCNRKSEEEQLYIVDSIKLGSSMKEYETQALKNKDIFSKKNGRQFGKLHFVTKMMLKQSEFYDHYIAGNYTTTFNINDNDIYTDYGLIVPITSSTQDNLLGTIIYFGRTEIAIDLDTAEEFTHNENPIPYFTQSNRALYISRVKDLLIKKYGQPTKITTDNNIPFYVFEGKEIQPYGTDKDHKGELLEWDNDIVKITLFTGIDNYNFTYDYESNIYIHHLGDRTKIKKELEKNREPTKAYAYLRYELKEDYIKRKKLDEPNL